MPLTTTSAPRRRLVEAVEGWLLRLWYGGASALDWLVALPLAPFALVASGLVAATARRRRTRIRRQRDGETPPVIVVGNLVAGGAGKTPTVVALARELTARGHRVGLLARGYRSPHGGTPDSGTPDGGTPDGGSPDNRPPDGGTPDRRAPDGANAGAAASPRSATLVTPTSRVDEVGDEPLLLARLTGCPVAVGADRAAALALLVAERPAPTVVIADDGLQHVGLPRAVELVLVDERGFGNGHCLPAGPLREPVDRLATVDAVLLHRLDALPDGAPRPPATYALRTRISEFTSLDGSRHWSPPALAAILDEGPGRAVALAGIARPERFFGDLAALGLDVDPLPLPDHAAVDPALLDRLAGRSLVVTAKDAVKLLELPPAQRGTLGPVYVAQQVGTLEPALINWLDANWPAPKPRTASDLDGRHPDGRRPDDQHPDGSDRDGSNHDDRDHHAGDHDAGLLARGYRRGYRSPPADSARDGSEPGEPAGRAPAAPDRRR